MKAKNVPRIDLEGRTKLETVIPLSTPYLVFVDPSDICNAHCAWCPSGNASLLRSVGRKPRMMSLRNFETVLENLCDFPEDIKTLRLYKDGEPLLNPCFDMMVSHAKSTDRFKQIDTTTNGLLLSDKGLSESIIDAGLSKIIISVPQNYTREYVEGIRYFHEYSNGECKMYVKIIGDGMPDDAKKKFYDDFGDHCDRIFIENLAPCWPGYDVKHQEKGIYNQPLSGRVRVCPYIFYSMAVNSDLSVSLCFLDWRHDMIIGDLPDQSLVDIWNGLLLRNIRMDHLRGYKLKVTTNCAACGQLSYGAPDNLDPYAQELARKI